MPWFQKNFALILLIWWFEIGFFGCCFLVVFWLQSILTTVVAPTPRFRRYVAGMFHSNHHGLHRGCLRGVQWMYFFATNRWNGSLSTAAAWDWNQKGIHPKRCRAHRLELFGSCWTNTNSMYYPPDLENTYLVVAWEFVCRDLEKDESKLRV